MIRRSHVRVQKAKLAENEKFLADVLERAKGITTGKQWGAYLRLLMNSPLQSLVKTVYKVTVTFKYGLKKFVNDDLSASWTPNQRLFQVAYGSFEKNLNGIPTARISENDRWLLPHLADELTSVLKIMDEMIWNYPSKSPPPFVVEQQNRLLREKGDAFMKNPLYEEFVQWAFNPIHLTKPWFAVHDALLGEVEMSE
jgi:hypothetical protein